MPRTIRAPRWPLPKVAIGAVCAFPGAATTGFLRMHGNDLSLPLQSPSASASPGTPSRKPPLQDLRRYGPDQAILPIRGRLFVRVLTDDYADYRHTTMSRSGTSAASCC